MIKKLFALGFTVFAYSSMAQSLVGDLEKVPSVHSNELRYRCTVHSPSNVFTVDLVLDPATAQLTAELDDNVRVKGFASETLDRKTGMTYYFVQGGSEPTAQRLTLVTRNKGKWARFTRAYGADEFICEM